MNDRDVTSGILNECEEVVAEAVEPSCQRDDGIELTRQTGDRSKTRRKRCRNKERREEAIREGRRRNASNEDGRRRNGQVLGNEDNHTSTEIISSQNECRVQVNTDAVEFPNGQREVETMVTNRRLVSRNEAGEIGEAREGGARRGEGGSRGGGSRGEGGGSRGEGGGSRGDRGGSRGDGERRREVEGKSTGASGRQEPRSREKSENEHETGAANSPRNSGRSIRIDDKSDITRGKEETGAGSRSEGERDKLGTANKPNNEVKIKPSKPKFPWMIGRKKSAMGRSMEQSKTNLDKDDKHEKSRKWRLVAKYGGEGKKKKKVEKKDILVYRTETISTLNSFKDVGEEMDEDISRLRDGEDRDDLSDKGAILTIGGRGGGGGERREEETKDVQNREGSKVKGDFETKEVENLTQKHPLCSIKVNDASGTEKRKKKGGNPMAIPTSSTAQELEQILEQNRAKSKEREKSGKSNENDFALRRRFTNEGELGRQPLRRQGQLKGDMQQRERRQLLLQQQQQQLAVSMRHRLQYDAEGEFQRSVSTELLSPSEARKRRKQSSIKIQRQKRKSTNI